MQLPWKLFMGNNNAPLFELNKYKLNKYGINNLTNLNYNYINIYTMKIEKRNKKS